MEKYLFRHAANRRGVKVYKDLGGGQIKFHDQHVVLDHSVSQDKVDEILNDFLVDFDLAIITV